MAVAPDLDPAFKTATTGTAVTSDPFSPAAGSLIVVVASTDSGTGAITCAFTDSVGLTWTEPVAERVGASGGAVAVARAYTTTARTNMTVTTTWSGAGVTGGKGIKPTTFIGTHDTVPIGATTSGTSSTNNLTVSYVNTVDGSRGFAAGTEWNALGLPTSTDTEQAYHLASVVDGISLYKAANTTGTGQTVNLNLDAGGSGGALWSYIAFEILPAAGGGTDATATPATIATTAALPRPAVNVTAGPATIVATVALPAASALAGGGATATPATIACTASLPQPAVNVTAGPAVIPIAVTLPQAGLNTAAGPQTVATTVTIPQPAVNTAVGATTIAATVALPTAIIATAGSATATPSTVAVTVALPRPGVNVTAGPVAIQATVTLPQPAAGVNTVASPATIATSTALPAAGLNVAAGPSTVVLTVTLPLASIGGTLANATSVAAVVAAVASVAAVSAGRTSSATVGRSTTSTSSVSDG